MPIVGPLFSKIKDFGDREKQYDMCGTDFNKLPPAEQAGYYVTLRPGAKPVKYIDTPDGAHVKLHRKFAGVVKGMSGLLSAHTGPDAKKTACEIKVDAGLPWPLRSVMEVCRLRAVSLVPPQHHGSPLCDARFSPALAFFDRVLIGACGGAMATVPPRADHCLDDRAGPRAHQSREGRASRDYPAVSAEPRGARCRLP